MLPEDFVFSLLFAPRPAGRLALLPDAAPAAVLSSAKGDPAAAPAEEEHKKTVSFLHAGTLE